MIPKNVLALMADKKAIDERLEVALQKAWPVGTTIRARAQNNHHHPSTVIVEGHRVMSHARLVVRWPSGHTQSVSVLDIVG